MLRTNMGHTNYCHYFGDPVFQITFKGRVPTRSFEGSIDVGLPTCIVSIKFPIYFVGSGGQLSWVFDLRPLSYLEHCDLSAKCASQFPHERIKANRDYLHLSYLEKTLTKMALIMASSHSCLLIPRRLS